MIERDKFILLLQRLEMAYTPKLHFDQNQVNLWYEMFQDCAEEGLKLAVDKCIKESEFAPNIAGLMKYYRELETEHNELKDLIQAQYTTIRSIWGEDYDSDTFKEIAAYILRQPRKMRKVEMVELTHRAVSFRHDCDACGRVEIPTIKEYVQGAR